MRVLSKVIDEFCQSSGHKVNIRKTQIYFSNNVSDELQETVSCGIGFSKVNDLGRYLGVPLLHK